MIVLSLISAQLPGDPVLQHDGWAVSRENHILKSRYCCMSILSAALISCFLLWDLNNWPAVSVTGVWHSVNAAAVKTIAFLINKIHI